MNENKMCAHLLVGITGSVHALNIYAYLRLFRESLAEQVKVIMTANATRFADPVAIQALADSEVITDLWDQEELRVPHIELTRWADAFIVVPATANIIGKAANGIADDLVSTAILSYPRQIIYLPAMNVTMWQSKSLQRNIQTLKSDGHYIVPPDKGIAIATNEPDAVSPEPDSALTHIKHALLKGLRQGYWEEAIREQPLTPAQQKQKQLALKVNELNKPLK